MTPFSIVSRQPFFGRWGWGGPFQATNSSIFKLTASGASSSSFCPFPEEPSHRANSPSGVTKSSAKWFYLSSPSLFNSGWKDSFLLSTNSHEWKRVNQICEFPPPNFHPGKRIDLFPPPFINLKSATFTCKSFYLICSFNSRFVFSFSSKLFGEKKSFIVAPFSFTFPSGIHPWRVVTATF